MVKRFSFILVLGFAATVFVRSQNVYSTSSWEFIFGFSDVDVNGVNRNTGLRFSLFFNYGQQWHMDLTDNLGLYTGGYIHNIGFKIKENGIKDVYRTYSLGIPLALKLGSFKQHMYFFGGGEYEMFFHYKHKRVYDDGKDKYTGWFSSHTNRFVPSLFAGIQFPKGLNLKFTYLLDDFLNRDFTGNEFGEQVDYGNWQTQVFYITLSFNIKTGKYKDMFQKAEGEWVSL